MATFEVLNLCLVLILQLLSFQTKLFGVDIIDLKKVQKIPGCYDKELKMISNDSNRYCNN